MYLQNKLRPGCTYPNCSCHVGTGCTGNKAWQINQQNKEKQNEESN